MKIGEGKLSGESFPFPSPNPTPSSSKTFDFIESLLAGFPADDKKRLNGLPFGRFIVSEKRTERFLHGIWIDGVSKNAPHGELSILFYVFLR